VFTLREDTNQAQDKFRFVFDVLDADGTRIARLKYAPTGSNNDSAAIDIARIVEPQLKTQAYDSTQITSGVAFIGTQGSAKILGKDEVKSIRKFTVQAGSEYASVAGGPIDTTSLNQANTTVTVWREALFRDGAQYTTGSSTGYVASTASSTAWHTLAPIDTGVTSDITGESLNPIINEVRQEDYHVVAIGNDAACDYIHFKVFNTDGSTATGYVPQTATYGGGGGSMADGKRRIFVGAGPANFGYAGTIGTLSTVQAAIQAGTYTHYDIVAANSTTINSTNKRSKVVRMIKVDHCGRYDVQRLMYRNRLGGWDFFNFAGKSVETFRDIKRQSFERDRGNYDAINATTNFTYYGYERGKTDTRVDAIRETRVTTEPIRDTFLNTIRDVALSNDVYLLDGTKQIPVNVTDSSFVTRTSENDGFFRYSFTFERANNPRLA
tara:strand:+ start:1051 stop:2364 length:1314 start_codon:yes stop_codon:yes gene_type:complete